MHHRWLNTLEQLKQANQNPNSANEVDIDRYNELKDESQTKMTELFGIIES
jgi:hypothetical protein